MADMVLDTVHYDVLDADIRILLDNEHDVWFFGSDLGKVLGLSNINKNIAELPDGITTSYTIEDKLGRPQKVNIVSEAGLYRLIFKSRKPEAEAFVSWVTEEVLPQIRKTGCYVHQKVNAAPTAKQQRTDLAEALDVAERLAKTFSRGVQQAYLLEQDQAYFDDTSRHLLPKLAIHEATVELEKAHLTYDPSENTLMAARVPVADFASVNVGELARLYNNKHLTTTVINRFLTDGGYQVPISKRKFAKTAISKDIATEKKALTGDTAGRKYITGWRKTNELMSYLNSCVQKYLKQV